MAWRRAQWTAYQGRIDPERLVFIDETWAKTNMAPLFGWAPRGERLKAKVPHGHWKTMTFLAALRHDRVEAPWLINGPINGERFLLYVEKVLAPTLRPDDIVIMDNLGSHKAKAVRRAIRATGARLFFLPKYSPDLNPIEKLSLLWQIVEASGVLGFPNRLLSDSSVVGISEGRPWTTPGSPILTVGFRLSSMPSDTRRGHGCARFMLRD